MTTASRPCRAAAITATAERMPVTGTWPFKKPQLGRPPDLRGRASARRGRTGSPVTAAAPLDGLEAVAPGGSTTSSAVSGAPVRTASAVTMESMPPPKGTSGRRRRPAAVRGGRGRVRPPRARPPRARPGRARCGRANSRQPGQVEVPQETPLGRRCARCRPDRPRPGPPSCNRTPRPAGRPGGRPRRPPGRPSGRPARSRRLGEAVGRLGIVAVQDAAAAVDLVAVVAEGVGGRVPGHGVLTGCRPGADRSAPMLRPAPVRPGARPAGRSARTAGIPGR